MYDVTITVTSGRGDYTLATRLCRRHTTAGS
jgi:hypothetical protein